MVIYFVLLFIPILIQPFIGKYRKLYRNTMFLLIFLLLGLRDFSVGGDLESYQISYGYISRTSIFDVFQEYGTEPLFLLFNKICGSLSNGSFRFFLLASAFCFSAILSQIIYENCEKQWLSWFLFMAFGYLPYGFALIRASFTLLIGTYFLKYRLDPQSRLDKSSRLKFYFGEICAALFHYTGLVFFLIEPMKKLKTKKYYSIVYISLCIVVFVFGGDIVEIFANIFFPNKVYSFSASGGMWLLIVIFLIRIVMALFFPKTKKDERYIYFETLLELGILSQIITFHFSLWSRMTNLIVFYPFVVLPNYLSNLRLDKSFRVVMYLAVLALGVGMYFVQLNADSAEIVPYLLGW